jgi:STE24 endopeptidase
VINAFTWTFLAALAASTAARLWLAARPARHVRAHRDAVPASFAGAIELSAHQKAADYTVAKTRLGMADAFLSVAVVLALTLGGALQWMSDAWARLAPPFGIVHGALLVAGAVALLAALELPVTLYRTFVIEERFGFNRMTLRLFAADALKGIVLAALFGIPLLLAVLWLMDKAGTWWWLHVWAVLLAFSVFMQLVVPTFILPWFNKFTPLGDGPLAERVRQLLARCGFRSRGLFVMDGSKRSSHGNAFFAGIGASKRIVLFDTLVERLDPDEVEAVLAHELGHYKLHHIRKMLAFNSLSTLAGLFVLGLLVDRPWFYEGLGAQTKSLAMALVLFVLVAPAFTFFLHPLGTLLSRRHEFEADAYATRHSPASNLVQALVKLYRDNSATLTPDPVHSAFYDSHPPAAARIARLRTQPA